MYGLTRGALTLIGVVVAGFLLWLGTQILPDSGEATSGEYWAALGLVAAAGLTMALSQLLGGWTKWGWPRVSGKVFLLGFLPALILGGWVLAAGDPGDSWFGRHVGSWSEDIGIDGVVADFGTMIPAIAFGIGLVFGFTFDTTGPRVRKADTGRDTEAGRHQGARRSDRPRAGDNDRRGRGRSPCAHRERQRAGGAGTGAGTCAENGGADEELRAAHSGEGSPGGGPWPICGSWTPPRSRPTEASPSSSSIALA